MDTKQQRTILQSNHPKIRVTKMLAGFYQWATIPHAMCDHSLLSEVEKFMDRYGYEWSVVKQKEEEIEDPFYVPFRG